MIFMKKSKRYSVKGFVIVETVDFIIFFIS